MSLKAFSPYNSYMSTLAKRLADTSIDLFDGNERVDSMQTIDSVMSYSMDKLEELIGELNSGPNFNDYFIRQDASVLQLNGDLQKLRDQLLSGVRNMVRMEERQLNDFNICDQRVAFLKGRLADIERDVVSIESGRETGDGTIVFSEDFGDLSFIDMDQTPQDKMPTLRQGLITLPEESVADRQNMASAKVTIDRINRNKVGYPSEIERPVSVAHEGRYYGFAEDLKPEGGKWNIKIREVSAQASEFDLLGLAHDASTFLQDNPQDLDELLPADAGEEPSNLLATNLGWPDSEISMGRNNILDDNPETIWEMEYLIQLETNENLTTDEISKLEADISELNKGSLQVALLIDLGRQIRTNGANLIPFMAGKQTNLTARLEIAARDPGGLLAADPVGPFSWVFPTQDVRFMRLTLEETAIQLTPYPVMVVDFKRIITHISESQVVPN